MNALVMDGKAVAAKVRQEVAQQVAQFAQKHHRVPGLAVILAGDDPASQVYVRNKEKAALEVGMHGEVLRFPATVTAATLIETIDQLNRRKDIDGILVQLPLPKGLDENSIVFTVDPRKDVDGLLPINAGRLASGAPALVPCTPLGSMRLLDEAIAMLKAQGEDFKIEGANAVVVGRSNLVGKPVAQLLLQRNATVTMAHSRTRNLQQVCAQADILVAAVGRPQMLTGDFIKPGAIVIDVGINRLETPDGKGKLVGDVHFAQACEKARAITPVPGGVGPMTIAYLLSNTVRAALLGAD